MKCKGCGAQLNLTMSNCPVCGIDVPMGRLTGLLGIVCRHCDAYNEPSAETCISCGHPLAAAPAPPVPPTTASPTPPRPTPGPTPILLTQAVSEDLLKAAPVIRSFSKLTAAGRAAAAEPAPPQVVPVSICPHCGQEAGVGETCGYCRRSIGARGAHVTPPTPPEPKAAPQKERASLAEPSVQMHAQLTLERGEGQAGKTFQIGPDDALAGRSVGALAFPSDPCLSPHHATFFFRSGALHVRDEGGANGLFLRLRAEKAPLKPGELFSIGDRLLRFVGVLPSALPPAPDGTLRFGSPRPQVPSILFEEWIEGGLDGRVFLRSGPAVIIGRAGCAISFDDDPLLSQTHAEITLDSDGAAAIRDLGSSSGTFLQVSPNGEVPLQNGDAIRMGREVLRVAIG